MDDPSIVKLADSGNASGSHKRMNDEDSESDQSESSRKRVKKASPTLFLLQ